MTTDSRVSPLRVLFGAYLVVFVATLVTATVAPDRLRPALVALGVLAAVIGLGLATNVGDMAAEAALRNRGSRWVAPIFGSVPFLRVMGVFVALAGAGFAVQALLVDDL